MDFRVLGPLEVRSERGAVHLGGHKPRAVLAVLLLHANEPVSSARLVEAVWGEDETPELRKSLQVSVSRLRKALDDPEIVATKGKSYEVRVRPGELDAERFERLVEDGRRALASGQAEQASASLRESLALWRGPPLADLAVESFAETDIARLEEQRLAALETRVEADLAAGRHAALVGELRQLVADNPTRERLAGQLMLALYRCGRQAEALEAYRDARQTLVDEIGVEPGPELRRLHEAILRQDDSLEPPSRVPDLPRELDAATAPPLVGRYGELVWLRERWDRAQRGTGSLVTMTGAHGIGRSRLAAELAGDVHRLGGTVLYAAGAGPPDATLAALKSAREATSPTLLVVDDADRADDDVLAMLADLTRALPTMPVLALATGEHKEAFAPPDGDGALDLGPLDAEAVREIAAPYASDPEVEEMPVEWLLKTSDGVPRRVHELASEWARREAARRVDAVAGRTAAGRADLRSMEHELAGGVVELQRAEERLTLVGDKEAPVVCPFKGLAPFDVADAEYFFGRERLVAELVARLVGTSLLGVVGPSGSGKSSVVRAGLMPALVGGVLPGSEDWTQVLIRPGEHPLDELSGAVADIDPDPKVLLVVDQFEETFTACRDEDERSGFIAELVRVACDPHERGMVVLAIRADYYGSCAAYPELSSMLASNHVLVGPMRRDELRRAVEGPALRAGLQVDPELADWLVADVEDEPGALPLLSTSLLELWQRREGRRLRLSSYRDTGGVHGAVARLAEDGFARLDEAQQAVARTVLLRLAEVEIEGGVERRRLPREEVEDGRADVAAVIDLLADARLLTVSAGSVEFAHEALLREWPRLSDWIEDDREDLRVHRNLRSAAQEWQRLGRDEGALYRGSRLAEAREWSEHTDLRPSNVERDFLSASLGRERRDRGARRRRLRLAFAGLLTALAAITAIAVIAVYQGREAERQRDIAASRSLAANAMNTLTADPGLSLALARRAVATAPTSQAEAALRQAVLDFRALAVIRASEGPVYGIDVSRDGRRLVAASRDGKLSIWNLADGRATLVTQAHRGKAYSARFSPDERTVASAGEDTVTLTNIATRHTRVLIRGGQTAIAVAYAPDGEEVAAGYEDGTVRLAETEESGGVRELEGHRLTVSGLAFSDNGRWLASASYDGTMRLWDLHGADDPLILRGDPNGMGSVSFSPDGRRLIGGDGKGWIHSWSVPEGRLDTKIRAGDQPIYAARFSPDGTRIATAAEDGVVRVLDAASGASISSLRGHSGLVWDTRFSPSGNRLISAGHDGTVRVWDPGETRVMRGPVTGASFSRDGQRVIAGGTDGTVRIWRTDGTPDGKLRGHRRHSTARFSDDGRRAISASLDGTVRVWSTSGGPAERIFRDNGGQVYSAAFDGQARRIVSGGEAERVVVRSLTRKERVVLAGHGRAVFDVAFSPDDEHAISAGDDGTIRIWSPHQASAATRVLRGHRGAVNSAAFNRDGTRVVSAGDDGTVRAWTLSSGSHVALRGHNGPVLSAAFNSSGNRIVSAGRDGTVRVWDSRGGAPLVTRHAYRRAAVSASFSPSGSYVLSAGQDGEIRLSPCEVCGPLASVRRLARTRMEHPFSADERQRFLASG
jgi:WD40 repeat protein/DNA-binding SARP family transcriptional activator